jgi:hypothetical protein
MPDIFDLFVQMLDNPFRNRWVNLFFKILFGLLCAIVVAIVWQTIF